MRYEAKSVLIGRKKGTEADKELSVRPCFISLFNQNNPHLIEEGPAKVLEFEKVHKVIIKGMDINYLLPGNDIVLNNLKYVEIEKDNQHLTVTGKQTKH